MFTTTICDGAAAAAAAAPAGDFAGRSVGRAPRRAEELLADPDAAPAADPVVGGGVGAAAAGVPRRFDDALLAIRCLGVMSGPATRAQSTVPPARGWPDGGASGRSCLGICRSDYRP